MQVDFYLLKAAGSREQLACRLAEKAFSHGEHIHLHTESPEQTRMLDELLWTFKDGSFLPHEIISDSENQSSPLPPVTLSHKSIPPESTTILLNLAAEVPSFYEQFPRIIEIINQDETIKQQGRQRFSHYKKQGCQLRHYEI